MRQHFTKLPGRHQTKDLIEDPVFVRRFSAAYKDGVTQKALADRFGLSSGVVQTIAHMLGLPHRPNYSRYRCDG